MSVAAETIWLTAPGTIEICSEALGDPAPGELLCETIVTAISPGTELAAWTGQPPLRPSVVYPRLQGYCSVARVLVVGLGALGLTSVAMAALAGADVYALSDQPESARIAARYGAAGTFTRTDEPALQGALGPGADVVISTVNGWDDWQAALRLAGPNGVIACLGFPGRGQTAPAANPLDSQHFYMKQLRIEAVGWSPEQDDSRGFLRFNERANIAWLARMIENGRIDAAPLISATYPGRDIARAYQDLLARIGSPVTYLLEWAR